jgi:hypothetical protein
VEFDRGIDRSGAVPLGPVGRLAGAHDEYRFTHSARLGAGTLACPSCDVPVALAARRASPAEPLGCPFCGHAGAVRDFLSLSAPSRPARVEVRVVRPARRVIG